MINKYLTNVSSKQYINTLQSIINNYNNTLHSVIHNKPHDVYINNISVVKENKAMKKNIENDKQIFNIGDHVRIVKITTSQGRKNIRFEKRTKIII